MSNVTITPRLIFAIDPGNEESAFVLYDGSKILSRGKEANDLVLEFVKACRESTLCCVIEQIACFGMAVGAEVFETVYWSGRFAQAYGADRVHRIKRLDVKMHLCHDSRAKDQNIRQALIDRWGGKERAIGRKAAPGPLYGLAGDHWSALAVAVTWWDRNRKVTEAA